MSTIIQAGELKVGMEVAERDGYLLTVESIVKETAKTVTVKLTSMGAGLSFPKAGIVATFRKSSKLVSIQYCAHKVCKGAHNFCHDCGYQV